MSSTSGDDFGRTEVLIHPLRAAGMENGLVLCLAGRPEVVVDQGPWFVLRRTLIADVYLGCLADSKLAIWRWVEIWVENRTRQIGSLQRHAVRVSNGELDRKWACSIDELSSGRRGDWFATGYETNPLPVFAPDPRSTSGYGLTEWVLCKDDDLLVAAGLPPYSTTWNRYLTRSDSAGAEFLAVSEIEPVHERARSLVDAFGQDAKSILFNSQSSYIAARSLSPFSLDDMLKRLSGREVGAVGGDGFGVGSEARFPKSVFREIGAPRAILYDSTSRGARLLESFVIRLRWFGELMREVSQVTARRQVPFLNLSPASFEFSAVDADFATFSSGLVGPRLANFGDAIICERGTPPTRYFLPSNPGLSSIYLPSTASVFCQGDGDFRIRRFDTAQKILEGTFDSQTRIRLSNTDLVFLTLPLPSGDITIPGYFESRGTKDVRFKSRPVALSTDMEQLIKSREGLSVRQSSFEVLVQWSSPADLYSISILGVRMFLPSADAFPSVVDDFLRLAKEYKEYKSEDGSVGNPREVLGQIFASDDELRRNLGPSRMLVEGVDTGWVEEWIPSELWHDLLLVLISCVPGKGYGSVSQDLNDAPADALHVIYKEPLTRITELAIRAKSMLSIDWSQNRDVSQVVQQLIKEIL